MPDRPARAGWRRAVPVLVALAVAVALVIGVRQWVTGGGSSETVVRLAGSNTVGSALAPDLAAAFLRDRGATDVTRTEAGGVTTVSGTVPGGPVRVEIHAEGTETAFAGLREGTADVGMASRRLTPQEAAGLAGRGDLLSREGEHVLALDAVALIVRPDTGATALSTAQLRDVFTCAVTDWAQLGGRPGPITLLARDDNSGTFEFFRDAVLDGRPLCPAARRFTDSRALSEEVARIPGAIGFVGLPFVGGNRVLDVSDGAASPKAPTPLNVSTETYPLTRRLFLYLPTRPQVDPTARDLVEFALTARGQGVVTADQLVSPLYPPPAPPAPPCTDAPAGYCAAVAGARRVPFDVRFASGTDRVDNRAFRNLDLLAQELAAEGGRRVLLVGFADNAGAADANVALSRQRAAAVRDYLTAHGVTVAVDPVGFGEDLPVATNDTAEGREQNRRVEVWTR